MSSLESRLAGIAPPLGDARYRTMTWAHETGFAFASARWIIESLAATQIHVWAWVENQVFAAVKLVPPGQSAGQRMLHSLGSRLGEPRARAREFADSDIGISTTLSAVASARHEMHYTRLFRS